MTVLEGIVGNSRQGVADGTDATVRLGRTGALIVGEAHARYFEATLRNRIFHAVTATTGVAPGTALGTTSAFYLHNPIGSGIVLNVLRSCCSFISGTLGAGSVYYTSHTGVPVTTPTGTAIAVRSGLLGGNVSSVGLAFTTATVTTQGALRPAFNLGAFTTTTATPAQSAQDPCDGEFLVPPGFGIGLHSVAAAGTSPLVTFGMTWEEIPITP